MFPPRPAPAPAQPAEVLDLCSVTESEDVVFLEESDPVVFLEESDPVVILSEPAKSVYEEISYREVRPYYASECFSSIPCCPTEDAPPREPY